MNSNESKNESFDFTTAIELFPNLINLVNLSTLSPSSSSTSNATNTTVSNTIEDQESRNAKLEIGRTATTLRLALASLKSQATSLKSGNLSLDEQDAKIVELKLELESKRIELQKMADLFPQSNLSKSDADNSMEMD